MSTTGRPKGSKNKRRAPVREQTQIRLYPDEREQMRAHARERGLTFSEWARLVLRRSAGLPIENPSENEAL
jgi:hypothetical protein